MGDINPTERELEILKFLWQQGRSTVREVWRCLSRGEKELAYTTVLSLLQTMERKGLSGHAISGKSYLYSAKVRRSDTVRELAGRFLEKVFDGAMDEYLVHALQSRHVSLEELGRLEAMIAEAKKKQSLQSGGQGDGS